MLHTVVVVEGIVGSCGYMERFPTRFAAENRAGTLERLGRLTAVESFDEQGQLIDSKVFRLMRSLYPEL
jgi:hypothetical protein